MLEFSFSPFPVLQTGRLLLKKITNDDAPALFALRSDKEVMKYIDRPVAQSIQDVAALIKIITDSLDKNDGITWGIYAIESPETLIGTIGFWRTEKENHRAEIGYMLHPAYQGKGLVKEAIITVLEYGFSVMKLHSVEANINPANAASAALLEKLNFTQEAYYKENYYYNGDFKDSAVYSLLTPKK